MTSVSAERNEIDQKGGIVLGVMFGSISTTIGIGVFPDHLMYVVPLVISASTTICFAAYLSGFNRDEVGVDR